MSESRIQGFLVDPFEHTITAVSVRPDNIEDIYEEIGADLFTIVRPFAKHDDAVFVDDMGLMKSDQEFFLPCGYPQPLAGKGLVLGTTPNGESKSATIDEATLRESLRFLSPMEVRQMMAHAPDGPSL